MREIKSEMFNDDIYVPIKPSHLCTRNKINFNAFLPHEKGTIWKFYYYYYYLFIFMFLIKERISRELPEEKGKSEKAAAGIRFPKGNQTFLGGNINPQTKKIG